MNFTKLQFKVQIIAEIVSGLLDGGQHQDGESGCQARSGLQRVAGEERPRVLDLRPPGRPHAAVQLERQAAVPLPDGRILDSQQRGETRKLSLNLTNCRAFNTTLVFR